jgi:hypothetical protein
LVTTAALFEAGWKQETSTKQQYRNLPAYFCRTLFLKARNEMNARTPAMDSERSSSMSRKSHELTIESALSDPIVKAVMTADGVDPKELAALLCSISQTIISRSKRRRDGDPVEAKGQRERVEPGPTSYI